MSREQLTLDTDIAERLQELAKRVQRSREALLHEAVKNYLELQEWQLEDIRQGVVEADNGDFVTTEDMQKIVDEFRPAT